MTLFAETLEILLRHGLRCAVIGATAMAAHGVARATMDVDLLLVGRECLDSPAWSDLRQRGAEVEIRRGDADDPLEGVVRLRRAGSPPIDVIVGAAPWQQRAIDRATRLEMLGAPALVATARDLILLKLYAGSPQDRWDISRLLAVSTDPDLRRLVETELNALPRESSEIWKAVSSADDATRFAKR